MYDTIIIGAGPIGLACGIEAEKRNFRYLILEKGCLVNSIYHFPVNMTFFSTSKLIEIGDVPFTSIAPKPSRQEALEYYRRVKSHWKLNVKTYEKVEAITKTDVAFQVTTPKGTYATKTVIIAIGFYDIPNQLHVEGEALPKVKHYYDDPHLYFGQKVAVVGGGNSAAIVALETWRKGAEVTMIVRKPDIKRGVKYWIKPDIKNRIKEGSIKVHFNSQVTAIRPHEIDIQTPTGNITIANDFVLAMTGYQPDFEWLSKIGIEFSADAQRIPVYDETTFETNIPNIFMAGVVCGGMVTNRWIIEDARFHAKPIFEELELRIRN